MRFPLGENLAADQKKEKEEEPGHEQRFRIYAAITVVLIVLAVAVSLVTNHRQIGLKGCLGIALGGYRDSCLLSLANSTKNASVCGYISKAYSDYCYSNVGEASLSAKTCAMASSEAVRYSCLSYIANATSSPSACSYLNGSDNSGCVESLAAEKGNSSACYAMANATEAGICASGVNFGLAENLGRPSYCMLVSNETDINVTERIISFSSYVRYGKSQNSTSSLINPAEYIAASNFTQNARDACYLSVASRESNKSICKGISNPALESSCISSASPSQTNYNVTANYTGNNSIIANITKNATGLYENCAKIFGQANATGCSALVYLGEAVLTKNATLCTYISNVSTEYQCYSSIAQAYKNVSFCGYIKNFTYNQACVGNLNYNQT